MIGDAEQECGGQGSDTGQTAQWNTSKKRLLAF
jgi:hypothetical protein